MKKCRFLWGCLGVLILGSVAWAQSLEFLSTKSSEDGTVQLKWRSEPNALYRVEYVSVLADSNNWQTLEDDFASQGANTLYVDTGKYWLEPEIARPKNEPQRFYRVVKTATNNLTPPTGLRTTSSTRPSGRTARTTSSLSPW